MGPAVAEDSEATDGEEAAPPSVVDRLSRTFGGGTRLRSLALTGMFTIAVFWVLYIARGVVVPVVLALLLSFLLGPIVRSLGHVFVPKVVASTLLLLVLMIALGGVVWQLAEPAAQWAQRLPEVTRSLERKVRPLRRPVEQVSALADRVEKAAQVSSRKAAREVTVEKDDLLDSALSVLGALAAEAVIMLFALYFMLLYGDRLLERMLGLFLKLRDRERAATVLSDIERQMASYLQTITLINVVLGVAVGFAMSFFGMPNPWLWGVLATIVNFVPYLGAIAGVVTVAAAALLTYRDIWDAALPPLAYFMITSLEGGVITPMLLGRTFRVSPLVVFLWLLLWGWLWGVAGALVAVPLLVLVKITCEKSENFRPLAELLQR